MDGLGAALRDGLLGVAYQPIVEPATGVPVGAEALARWVHPEHGPVPPAAFVPAAERSGLIGAIDDLVRGEALRRLAGWRGDGTVGDDFFLSVNVSARRLTDADLARTVESELLQYEVPAHCVAFEAASPAPGRALFELRRLGCQVLLDDFGAGSPVGLLRLPVTGLKLDRSLLPADDLVRAVVTMGRTLGLTVIAKGVETRPQRDALAAAGVTRAQGWLWGPAVPPADFARHWHAERACALTRRARPLAC
ncbi:EAL domain-containing protein [Actinoplanes sp. URMC 104]|uniref:EAL domain-containing protein n=1 Tax=Actinoplanes sp. URMC 104 TaxID=3423409 RepID=UPI003F1DFCBE